VIAGKERSKGRPAEPVMGLAEEPKTPANGGRSVEGWETGTTTLTPVVEAAATGEAITVTGADDDLQRAAPPGLSHQILAAGEAVVDIGGELDIATADVAVSYVRQIIDRHRGPVIVDLSALGFCDASGLGALLRMAGYAKQAGRPFRLASPSRSLVKIMRITGLDRSLAPPDGCPPDR
jgi:anti-sigma B factor antagonist